MEYFRIQAERDPANLRIYIAPAENIRDLNSALLDAGKYLGANSFAEIIADAINNGGTVFGSAQGRSGLALKRYLEQLSLYGINVFFEGDTCRKTIGKKDILIAGTGSGTTPQTLDDVIVAARSRAKVIVVTANEITPIGNAVLNYDNGEIIKIPAKTKDSKNANYSEASDNLPAEMYKEIFGVPFNDLSLMGTDFERQLQIYLDSQIINIAQRIDKDGFGISSECAGTDMLKRLKNGSDVDDNLFEKTYMYYVKNSGALDRIDTDPIIKMMGLLADFKKKTGKVTVAGKTNAKAAAMRFSQLGYPTQVIGETTTGPVKKGDLPFIASVSGNSRDAVNLYNAAKKFGVSIPVISVVSNPGDKVESELISLHNTHEKGFDALIVVPISEDLFEYRSKDASSERVFPSNSLGDMRPQQNIALLLDALAGILSNQINVTEKAARANHANN